MNDDKKTVQTTPPVAGGSLQKEQGPRLTNTDFFVRPSEVKPSLTEEQVEAGIRAHSNNIALTDEHRQIGMQHAGASVPAPTLTSPQSHLPDEEEARRELNGTQPTDSERGRLLLIIKNGQRKEAVKAA